MFKVSITKNGILTNQAQFDNRTEAEQWLERESENGSFGKVAGTYPALILTELERLSASDDFEDEEGVVFMVIPNQFDAQIEDVSQEVAQENTNSESLTYLAKTDWMVLRHLRQKTLGMETSLSEEEFIALEEARAEAASRIVR